MPKLFASSHRLAIASALEPDEIESVAPDNDTHIPLATGGYWWKVNGKFRSLTRMSAIFSDITITSISNIPKLPQGKRA